MDAERLQQLQDTITRVIVHVLRPFFAFNQHDSLLYWPFLLSTLAISLLVFAITGRAGAREGRQYFSRAVWWHPSARADYRYYLANAIIFPLIFAPLIVTGAWIGSQVQAGLAALFGPAPFAGGAVWLNLAFTVVFFLAYDLGRYLGHWVQHRFDVLWQFHKVHHSAEVLTPFTNYRAHPVDLFCMHSFPGVLTGLTLGLFAWASGGSAGYYLFFGLHAGVFGYNLLANLRHSHVWLSYGPVLSHLLISPAQHQIHHSVEPRHWGRNIGFALAIWDWMFGTLYVPQRRERFAIGLGDGSDAEFHGVWRMYWRPVAALWRGRRGRSGAPTTPTAGAGSAG